MKKIALLLACSLFVSLTGCSQPSQNGEIQESNGITTDKGFLDVTIVFPAHLANTEMTQEDYDALAEERSWKSVTLNEDGSVTYTMSKIQHNKLMRELDANNKEMIEELVSDGEIPNLVSISANKNYSEFEVRLKNNSVSFFDSILSFTLNTMSAMYNVFSGENIDNCRVIFIHDSTGTVIEETNSRDTEEQN